MTERAYDPCDPYCYRPKSSRFAKILCPRITLIDANHDRVSSRNLGTFGVRGALAPLSMLGSIQSDTKTCRTPKGLAKSSRDSLPIRVHSCHSQAKLRLRRSRAMQSSD